MSTSAYVQCPACLADVPKELINDHLDRDCAPAFITRPQPVSPGAFNKAVTKPTDALVSPRDAAPPPGPVPGKRPREPLPASSPQPSSCPPAKEPRRGPSSPCPPLAEHMRPCRLGDLLGQDEAVGPGTPLRALVESDALPSLILWGPPGCGKASASAGMPQAPPACPPAEQSCCGTVPGRTQTSFAHVVSKRTGCTFRKISATEAGVKQIRQRHTLASVSAKVVDEAESTRRLTGRHTILFVDEIHHFNKSQQDAFLCHVEAGKVTLMGATTENPSFSLNSALLSRCRVYTFRKLAPATVEALLSKALQDPRRGLAGQALQAVCPVDASDTPPPQGQVPAEVTCYLSHVCDGDARVALNALDVAASSCAAGTPVTLDVAKAALQKTHLLYDRAGDQHYSIISALHKSMRGSDPDAALYWLARMLEAGEDP
eukprot:gene4029-4376_t